MTFESLDHSYAFYLKYATAEGFAVRKGTEKINAKKEKHIKYYMCMKSSLYKNKKVDKLDPKQKERSVRSNFYKRTGYGAKICIEFEAGFWKLYKFVEEHKHEFVDQPDKHFLPSE
ncbi:uncharacterized protein LOC110944240 [Helianthus annuus]|uniref:uncharacterized protein LOC110944240 n=1 Tax=Helianthus annuus TaxID=4232 RepID=UPI000B900AD9|nr:uncharacterized protein LOC110944240 [Helianthus annuus]